MLQQVRWLFFFLLGSVSLLQANFVTYKNVYHRGHKRTVHLVSDIHLLSAGTPEELFVKFKKDQQDLLDFARRHNALMVVEDSTTFGARAAGGTVLAEYIRERDAKIRKYIGLALEGERRFGPLAGLEYLCETAGQPCVNVEFRTNYEDCALREQQSQQLDAAIMQAIAGATQQHVIVVAGIGHIAAVYKQLLQEGYISSGHVVHPEVQARACVDEEFKRYLQRIVDTGFAHVSSYKHRGEYNEFLAHYTIDLADLAQKKWHEQRIAKARCLVASLGSVFVGGAAYKQRYRLAVAAALVMGIAIYKMRSPMSRLIFS